MTRQINRFRLTVVCIFAVTAQTFLAVSAVLGQSERPASQDLLPETTVLYIQIKDVRELVQRMSDSSMGQMLRDENIAPLAEELYQQAKDAYADIEGTVGLSLEEIQSLPSGEIVIAMIAPKRKDPAFVFMVDTDEESETVDKAIDRGREFASQQGAEFSTEEADEVTYESVAADGNTVTYFRKDGLLVGGNNSDVLKDMVERWMGREVEKVRPLSSNRKFVTIMNRCRGTKETPPDMRFFVDPIALAHSVTRGNIAAQAGLNFLPVLGLDGLLGIGGSAILEEEEFESITHLHVLLSNPRSGIFEMVSLKPSDYRPEQWVPADTVNYISTSWDIDKMFAEFEKIFDTFSGEGTLRSEIEENFNQELGIDFEEDLLSAFTGRFTYVQWMEPPARINSQTNVLGVELKDPQEFEKLIELFMKKMEEEGQADEIEEATYKGVRLWKMPDDERQRQEDRIRERGNMSVTIRVAQPSFAIVGNYLIVTDSVKSMERAIETDRGDLESLANEEEFKLVSRKMIRLLGTDVPACVMYSRPEETMRMLFDVADSDGVKEFFTEAAEANKYAAGLKRALDENPLPDFDQVKHYFRPSGAFITDDETGYHLLGFQLRPNDK